MAQRHGLPIVFVANQGARPSRDPMVRYVTVSAGPDAADDWIVDNVLANDLVVTADILLAERAIAEGAHVLGPNGHLHTPASIGMAVAMRNLRQHLRESGEDRGLNAGFTLRDRARFLQTLHETAQRALRQQK